MRRRKLVIALGAAALFGVAAVPASAELRRVAVTLVTGQTVEVTVDVPPGASVQSVALPSLPAPGRLGHRPRPGGARRDGRPRRRHAVPHGHAHARRPVRRPNVGAGAGSTRAHTKKKDAEDEAKPKRKRSSKPADGNTEAGAGSLEPRPTSRPTARAPAPATPRPRTRTARRRSRTPRSRSRRPAPRASACPTSSSRSSASRRSCSRSTRPRGSSTACAGRSWPRSTRSRPTTAATSTSPRRARSAGCSSCPAPGTMYGVDGNRDGKQDPYNPVDAIFAAARYLKAAGADSDLRGAIFAYNHADWYVDSVLLRAGLIGGLPERPRGLAHRADAGPLPRRREGDLRQGGHAARPARRHAAGDNAAYAVDANGQRNGIKIFSRAGAPVVAVNDGRIVHVGRNRRLGRFVQLQDVYGNTYTYGHLGKVAASYATPKQRKAGKREIVRELSLPARDAAPKRPASQTTEAEAQARKRAPERHRSARRAARTAAPPVKERLYAHPDRANAAARPKRPAGEPDFADYLQRMFGLDRSDIRMKPLRAGARVPAGTILGRLGHAHAAARAAAAVRDPARRPRRPARRPEADPRRLEAARVDGHLPGGRPQPVLRRGRPDAVGRPDPADGQGRARRARAGRPERPDLRLRAPRRAHGPDRPPRAGDARVPRRVRAQADGDVAPLRPLLPDRVRQRLRALDRNRRRHRRHQRHPASSATRARARSRS